MKVYLDMCLFFAMLVSFGISISLIFYGLFKVIDSVCERISDKIDEKLGYDTRRGMFIEDIGSIVKLCFSFIFGVPAVIYFITEVVAKRFWK